MSVPNFNSLAGLEVPEKFVWVVVVGSKWLLCLTSTKLLLSFFEVSGVELRWVLAISQLFDNIISGSTPSVISLLLVGFRLAGANGFVFSVSSLDFLIIHLEVQLIPACSKLCPALRELVSDIF